MLRPRDALVCGLLVWGGASMAAPPSAATAVALGETGSDGRAAQSGRKLTGRFLHITDFHPDPFYKTYSSTTAEAACHRQRGPAGIYGAETSGCDSPFSLVNETFRWIKENVRDDIDFVIWTGDSARHDNDEKHARTQKQVISQNEFLVEKFREVFGVSDEDRRGTNDYVIPIVPTFGNNDIMPHNIFLEGPNKWTMKYLDIWRSFIPEAQRHQFQQGGWFSVEVIPDKLAVISLNTIYFFTSNSGVDGCANRREPGYQHMEWLRIQLDIMRERGVKAILMGHVAPARVDNKESWDETCWQKYTLWVQQYRDVIVGSLYGHMNIDHFMLQDFEQIDDHTRKGDMATQTSAKTLDGEIRLLQDGEVTVASASDYLLGLRAFWAQLPSPLVDSNKKMRAKSDLWDEEEDNSSLWGWLMSKVSSSRRKSVGKSAKKKYLEKIGGKYAQRYSASLVSPSVVPNYYPTLRIIEYNITGLEHLHVQSPSAPPQGDWQTFLEHQFSDDEGYTREVDTLVRRKQKQKSKERASKHSKKKYRFKVPEGPSKSVPPGPAYSPQPLTWTRYTQYFANLTRINNDFVDSQHRRFGVDGDNTSANELAPRTIFGLQISVDGDIENKSWKEGKHGHHNGKHPRPEPHPKEFVYEVEYDTKEKKFPDLTVRRWVEYARKIGGGSAKGAHIDYEQEDNDEFTVDEEIVDGDGVETEGKKHKKHKKGKKHRKASKEWFTFVKRAFVGTMDPHEIRQVFGRTTPAVEEAQEVMEL